MQGVVPASMARLDLGMEPPRPIYRDLIERVATLAV